MEYKSKWKDQIDDLLGKIKDRPDFKFDVNGDAVIQSMRDKAAAEGQMAMKDTLARASAMTGGHNNSYGQGVAQQAYQSALQRVDTKIPAVMQLAMSRYDREGAELKDQLGILMGLDDRDYKRAQDAAAMELAQMRAASGGGGGGGRGSSGTTEEEEPVYEAPAPSGGKSFLDMDRGFKAGTGKGVPLPPTYNEIWGNAVKYMANGAPVTDVSKYLYSAEKSGYITPKQHDNMMRNVYARMKNRRNEKK